MRFWPKRRFHKICLSMLLSLIALAIIDQAWIGWDRRIPIRSDTTFITGPLDNGYPDYLGAINASHAQGITSQNNAFILVGEVCNQGDLSAAQMNETYRLLGTHPPTHPPLLISYAQWLASHDITPPIAATAPVTFDGTQVPIADDAADWEFETAYKHPWVASAHPLLSGWLRDMEPAFALLEQAVSRDRFFRPLVTEEGVSSGSAHGNVIKVVLPALGSMREATEALLARANQRLQAGDAPGFQRDITICLRLSRLLAQQPTMIEYLLAMSNTTIIMCTIQEAAASNLLLAPDAHALRQILQDQGPFPSPAHAFDECERFELLDVICTVHANRTDGSIVRVVNAVNYIVPVNYAQTMRRANALVDKMARAFLDPHYADRQKIFDACEREIVACKPTGYFDGLFHPENLILAMYANGYSKINTYVTANLQERDLAILALALRESHAAGTPYPESLSALNVIPVPNDQFTDQPLIYRKQNAGYLLYSLGPKLQDDAGKRSHDAKAPGNLSVEASN